MSIINTCPNFQVDNMKNGVFEEQFEGSQKVQLSVEAALCESISNELKILGIEPAFTNMSLSEKA